MRIACVLFLSYGRRDDEAFVARLYERLRGEGLDVWWDRVRMPSRSLTFLKEIREAVRAADRVLVVLGPRCVVSDYCRAEWQTALAESKVVTPILRLGTRDQLPPELAGLHCPDLSDDARFEEGFADLLRILAEPAPPLGALHGGVPDVPPHFQPRPQVASDLSFTMLIDERAPVVLAGPDRVTLLHGMPGVGKSVLAAAFARATTTRRSFSGGVFWLTAGDATADALVARLVQLLGRPPPGNGDAVTHLTAALAPLSALMVVDDVWQVDQVAPLVDALGPSCRLLVTCRSSALAAGLGGSQLPLDVLTQPEALRQLADWTGSTPEELPEEALAVAEACGWLPFALALNGAMYSTGVEWPHLLAMLRAAEIDYAEHKFKGYPYRTVLASLKVSLDALDVADAGAGQRLRELAAFHPTGGIPEAAVQRLWAHTGGLAPAHVAKVLAELSGRGFLRVDGTPRRVRMHDLQFDYLTRLTDPADREAVLLGAYEAACDGEWARVPADGYIHRHLIHHLLDAGRDQAARELLDETTPGGRNAWYEAQLAAEDAIAYLEDVERLLQATDDEAHALRLVLMRASVRDVLAAVPVKVRVAMLHTGATDPSLALAAAAAITNPDRRLSALLAAAAALDERDPQRERALVECLATARGRSNRVAADRLARIAILSAPVERAALAEEALQAARDESDPAARARALVAVVPLFDEDVRGTLAMEALQAARDESDPAARAGALVAIAPLFDEDTRSTVAAEAEMALRAISVRSDSFLSAARAVLTLRPGCAPECLDAAAGISDPFRAASFYMAIVPHLPPELREAAAREGIRRHETSRDPGLALVVSLARHIPDFDLDTLVNRATQDPERMPQLIDQLDSLSADASWKANTVTRVSAAADGFPEPSRTLTRIALLAHRAESVDDLLAAIADMPYDSWRQRACIALVPYLDADGLRAAGYALARIDGAADLLAAAARLARHGDRQLRDDLCAAVDALPASEQRFAALVALAESFEEPGRRSATALAACTLFHELGATSGIIDVVARLSPLLDDETRERLLQAALQTPLMLGLNQDFLALEPLLSDDAVVQGHRVLLALAERSQHRRGSSSDGEVVHDNSVAVAGTIASLAPTMPKALAAEAFAFARRIEAPHWRFVAGCHLAPALDRPIRDPFVAQLLGPGGENMLATGLQSSDAGHVADAACRALGRLAAIVENGDLDRCRQLIRALAPAVEPAFLPALLETIAPHLEAADLESQIERAMQYGGPYAMLAVARVVAPPRRHKLLLEAFKGTTDATDALLDAPTDVREHAWAEVRTAGGDRKALASTLAATARVPESLGRADVLASVARSLLTVIRWWP
jgi:hypothetical protein